MKAPSVSGALEYKTLCIAAKNEEKRIAELRKRRQYQTPQVSARRHPKEWAIRNLHLKLSMGSEPWCQTEVDQQLG